MNRWRVWYKLEGKIDSLIVKGERLTRHQAIAEVANKLPKAEIGQVEKA